MSISAIGTTASSVNPYTASAPTTDNTAPAQPLISGASAVAAQTLEDSMLLGGGGALSSDASANTDYVYQALMMKAGAPVSASSAAPNQAALSYNATSAQAGMESAIIDSIA